MLELAFATVKAILYMVGLFIFYMASPGLLILLFQFLAKALKEFDT